jgi:hypothetical protein
MGADHAPPVGWIAVEERMGPTEGRRALRCGWDCVRRLAGTMLLSDAMDAPRSTAKEAVQA